MEGYISDNGSMPQNKVIKLIVGKLEITIK